MEEKEFEDIYRRYHEVLYYSALRIVSSPEIAEDILQSVFTDFWFHRSRIDGNRSVKSYLYTMVRNRSLDYLKSSGRRQCRTDVLLEEYLLPVFSVENDVQSQELRHEIRRAVQELPGKCREVFRMSREQGLKNEEIADRLNIHVKTVEKHLTKALSRIRLHLFRIGYLLVLPLFF